MKLTPLQIAQLAYEHTGWRGEDLVTVVAVALGESGGDPTVQSKVDKRTDVWGISTGLLQIHPLNEQLATGKYRDETRLTDPVFNLRSGYQIYREAGNSFRPWGAWWNRSYERHLTAAQVGVADAEEARRFIVSVTLPEDWEVGPFEPGDEAPEGGPDDCDGSG